jgi:hypothetical protein
MSYSVEYMGGGVVPVFGIALLLLIVPELAAIAVVVATIAVLVGLVALAAAAALASPYLLLRSVRHRLHPTKNMIDPPAERDRGADRPPARLRVLGRAQATAFTHDEDEAGAILASATRDAA